MNSKLKCSVLLKLRAQAMWRQKMLTHRKRTEGRWWLTPKEGGNEILRGDDTKKVSENFFKMHFFGNFLSHHLNFKKVQKCNIQFWDIITVCNLQKGKLNFVHFLWFVTVYYWCHEKNSAHLIDVLMFSCHKIIFLLQPNNYGSFFSWS